MRLRIDQIRNGRLNPNDPLPPARKTADLYAVASMTAQRALRELQHRRITYSVAGKGTFVHPNAFDLLRGGVLREPIDQERPADPGRAHALRATAPRAPVDSGPRNKSNQPAHA